MATGFFYKKIVKGGVCLFAFAWIVFSLGYAVYLSSATVVNTSKNFYFLVSSSAHIEVSAHQATQMGGAGYLFEQNGRESVALSVYCTKIEAVTVHANLKDGQTEILFLQSPKLYLKTRKQKQKKQVYKNAFCILSDCINFLDTEIDRLEKGATQQSSKRILAVLKDEFSFLQKEYQKDFAPFATVCKNAEENLACALAGVVYLEDLRYLLCDLSVSYIRLSEEFQI